MVEDRLNCLLSAWQAQQVQGRDVPATELCRDCPELAEELSRRIAVLRQMNQLVTPPSTAREPHAAATPPTLGTDVHQSSFTGADSTRISGPPREAPTEPSFSGSVPGYEVLERLGQGGMGVVYQARQAGLNRLVALKTVKAGHQAGAEELARFCREAQVTGGLEHPGIVPIYFLGNLAGGQPFYAMRLLQGDSLKAAIDRFHEADRSRRDPQERNLALRDLLGRFIIVCNAVAYAHSRGILHRDLKPENVLLGRFGESLVVDWGLAKPLDQAEAGTPEPPLTAALGENPEPTQLGALIGTPAYMSPEQACGATDRVGPASDVYSLGATLYYLLSGQPPFVDRDLWTLLQKVQRGEFEHPRRVRAAVPSPLEAICLKAMAHKPEDRYPTARALAEDVEHWLADEPVTAYRESWLRRVARWGRRHRPLVAGAAALLLTAVVALAAGIVVVKGEQKRTELARQRTREALDEMSSQVIEDWLAQRKELEPAQKAFLERALALYEGFAAESGHTQEIRKGVADAQLRVGNIRYRLGQHKEAEAAYRRAQDLYANLAADFPTAPEYRQVLARSHNNLGALLSRTGRPQEAEAAYRDALALREQLAADFPAVAGYREELAQSLNSVGNLLADTGRPQQAEAAYRDALAVQRQLATEFPTLPQYRQGLAMSYNNLGELLRSRGRPQQAEAAYRETVALEKRLAADFPTVPRYRLELGIGYNNLGIVLENTSRPQEAEAAYCDALVIQQQLSAEFPLVPQYRSELGQSYSNLAELLRHTGRPQQAEAAYRDVLAIFKRLVADFPTVSRYQGSLANNLDGVAELARDRKDFSLARQLLEQARPHLQAALDANPRDAFYRAVFCDNHQLLAATLLDLGDHASAALAAADLARIAFEPAKDTYKAAVFLSRCLPLAQKDTNLQEAKRKELAGSYADQAMELLRQAVAKGYKDAAHLKKDGDLDPLRARSDFQALLAELDKPAR
jgi:serine/threonine-protein kinase